MVLTTMREQKGCTIPFPVIALFVSPYKLNSYELHHQGEARSSQYSEPTPDAVTLQ